MTLGQNKDNNEFRYNLSVLTLIEWVCLHSLQYASGINVLYYNMALKNLRKLQC